MHTEHKSATYPDRRCTWSRVLRRASFVRGVVFPFPTCQFVLNAPVLWFAFDSCQGPASRRLIFIASHAVYGHTKKSSRAYYPSILLRYYGLREFSPLP